MKASRFNIGTTLADGTRLLFNFATLALVAVEPRAARKADRILDDPVRHASARGHRRLATLLERNGFLVPEGANELDPLEAAFNGQKIQSAVLSLTLLPTLSCNFDCAYCCQGPAHRGRMTQEVEEALAAFVSARLVRGGVLDVTWYGGEPLLAKPVIERLSRVFLSLCEERGVRYEAGIITNGYLLDATTAQWLSALGVRTAQVTLDGPPEVHDRRRPLASGGATFARIVENVAAAADTLDIAIRTNVDGQNPSCVGQLLDSLAARGVGHKVRHYAAPVTPSPHACPDGSARCLASETLSLVTLEASLDRTRKGLVDAERPRVFSGPCGATRGNSFVVAPDGGLAACWEDAGSADRYVGHLLEPDSARMEANRQSWFEYSPFKLECRDCKVLPICMSHCPARVREGGSMPCLGWKHHPQEHLLNEYRLRELDRERQVTVGLAELRDALREAAGTGPPREDA